MYGLSLLLYFNCMTLYGYIYFFSHRHQGYLKSLFPSVGGELFIVFGIAGIIYLVFVRGGKYKNLFERLKAKPLLYGHLGTRITILYVFMSLLLFFSTIFLK